MNIKELKAILIPEITAFCKREIIMADDMGDKPTDPHATYKITRSYGKGVGRGEETVIQTTDGVQIKEVQEYRPTISFTAYAMDEDDSMELAQKIHDWFSFYGYEFLDRHGVVIAEQTDVTNRDAFVIENYERRNGFDVILKITREMTKDADWFDRIEGIND